ncbi:MAG: DEAD/DEAH box helicase family protein, partial [Anaerolineae bacterium]
MNIELKGFQETAARKMRDDVQAAQSLIGVDRSVALVLSSPTGSGKTVTVTALMEWLYDGFESFPPNPQATFLWLSDSPELNEQSRQKILHQSSVFPAHRLVTVEPSFSQREFEPGRIYFLNTQKLGKDSLLTKRGDGRDYTIWDTIQNTASKRPRDFFLIIDEAHRGMTQSRIAQNQAQTIVQRFIKGEPEVGLHPVKLIIGMSATPDRFTQLIGPTGRVALPSTINPDDVRDSGLLKDRIILYHPDESQPADTSMLEEAARQWQRFSDSWRTYGDSQGLAATVEPVLVIQIEDGTGDKLTNTNLAEVIEVVERVTGVLPEPAWAHSFQDDKTVEVNGRRIRKLDASAIQDDPQVKIVLFKMSLTTGWDCPRAEVMMSFRRAKDHTLIAQLVGRMVRTPLARKIEGSDFLNTVSLYLPHYDRHGLAAILTKLQNPDPETGVAVQVESGSDLVTYMRAPAQDAVFARLGALPSYRIERTPKSSNVRRLMKLSRLLTFDRVAGGALPDAKSLVINTLNAESTRLSHDPAFIGNMAANQEIEVREVSVAYGEWDDTGTANKIKIKATPENIEDLFNQASRALGEGLHMEYWRAHKNPDDPDQAKLQLAGITQDKPAMQTLEQIAGAQIQSLFTQYHAAIQSLPSSKQENYNRVRRAAKIPEPETLFFPPDLPLSREHPEWPKHLYVNANG